MRKSTRLMVKVTLAAAHVLGTLSFFYNHRTGEIYTTPWLTIYTAVISVAMFGVVPMLRNINISGKRIHVKINFSIFVIRITAVLVTMIFNWTKRCAFMEYLRNLKKLRIEFEKKWPLSQNMDEKFDRTLRRKFCWGVSSSLVVFVGFMGYLKIELNINNVWMILFLALMTNILNVVLTSYFFCILRINIFLAAINEEVTRILKKSENLAHLRSRGQTHAGFFITQCCTFADDLDELARFQLEFRKLARNINGMYEVQGSCVLLSVYLNSISVIYDAYISIHILWDEYTKIRLVFTTIALFLYFMDLNVSLFTMLEYQDLFIDCGRILKEHQTCLTNLDVRLEESVSINDHNKIFG